MAAFQRFEQRPVAHDHFRAGQIEGEEGLDILFHRDAADIEPDRPLDPQIVLSMEIGSHLIAVEIDAARPDDRRAEAALFQFALERGGRNHEGGRRTVEPAQEAIAP